MSFDFDFDFFFLIEMGKCYWLLICREERMVDPMGMLLNIR
jgi:hypothetical protein